jgi:hypothetical protein
MNKNRRSRLVITIATIFVIFLVSGVAVYAKQMEQSIKVIYNNIKIVIDGKEFKPKDAKGNDLEPFVYNGTTYLPVKAIANAFGKDVVWDAKTSTIKIGEQKVDFLDQKSYLSFESTGDTNFIEPFKNVNIDKINYARGIRYKLHFRNKEENTDRVGITTEYLLNKGYKSLLGTIIIEGENESNFLQPTTINFYGDDKLIYTANMITNGMEPINTNIDVSNINILKIETVNKYIGDSGMYFSDPNRMILFSDARLTK